MSKAELWLATIQGAVHAAAGEPRSFTRMPKNRHRSVQICAVVSRRSFLGNVIDARPHTVTAMTDNMRKIGPRKKERSTNTGRDGIEFRSFRTKGSQSGLISPESAQSCDAIEDLRAFIV